MTEVRFTRRAFVLAGIFLSGCVADEVKSVDMQDATSAFDGRYEIFVGRIWNDTPTNRANPYYANHRDTPESLGLLTATVVDGRFTLNSVSDRSVGNNYSDFNAFFRADGTLEMSTTAGYLVGLASPYKLRLSALVGGALEPGKWITMMPSRGFDPEYRAIVKIRKLS